jgi:hypothetical protein
MIPRALRLGSDFVSAPSSRAEALEEYMSVCWSDDFGDTDVSKTTSRYEVVIASDNIRRSVKMFFGLRSYKTLVRA